MTFPMTIAIGLGVLALLGFDHWFFRVLKRQPEGLARAEASGDGTWLLVPIGLALVAFFTAKQLGYRRVGVGVALAVLSLNTIVMAATRLAMVRQARFARPIGIRLSKIVLAQAVGTMIGWAGVGWYLLA